MAAQLMLRLAKGVADNSSLRDSALSASSERDGDSRSLEFELRNIASIAVRACNAGVTALSCALFGTTADVRAGDGSAKWDAVLEAACSALANRMLDSETNGHGGTTLSAPQLESLIARARKVDPRARIHAAALSRHGAVVKAIAITTSEIGQPQLEASLELAAEAAAACCRRQSGTVTAASWRQLAADAAERAAASLKALDEVSRRIRDADDAARLVSLAARDARYERLGAFIADAAGAHDWGVGRTRGAELEILAASRKFELDSVAIADALSNSQIVVRDRFTYVPLGEFIVALVSRTSLTDDARARLEAIAARLRDTVRIWQLEADDAARQALLQRMALRMFAAVDEERARIARDLHDDQAQLLTAAKIALEGGRDEARAILSQVEGELRRRTRELRPALLGAATLDELINRELERLGTVGIAARFNHGSGASRISRPIQQLCYQVTREAVSNVIRHAHARSVEVKIGRQAGGALVTISDDGRGIEAGRDAEGVGLKGVRERVELLGGKLSVQSGAHGTVVSAEIPEPME
ncbi:MAG TPA: ATP-binding protein [Candidatus Binataceae bacterium]|nr:ATP-binding protein [Candidatus Binataceae bacterium]